MARSEVRLLAVRGLGLSAMNPAPRVSDVMAAGEKALTIATARERVKIIGARIELIRKELEIAMAELVSLQAQLAGTVKPDAT